MINKPDYEFMIGCIALCNLCYIMLTIGGE